MCGLCVPGRWQQSSALGMLLQRYRMLWMLPLGGSSAGLEQRFHGEGASGACAGPGSAGSLSRPSWAVLGQEVPSLGGC